MGPARLDRSASQRRHHLKFLHALWVLALLCVAPPAWAEEPDHAIHEELRGVLREVVSAMNSGQYDKMLPYLTEDVEATGHHFLRDAGRLDEIGRAHV